MKKRDYKAEYRKYHDSPEQIRDRSMRNQARREAGCGKGQEADHIKPLSRGGSNRRSNVRCVTRRENRVKGNRSR